MALASPAVSPSQEQPFHGIKIGIGALPQSDMLSRERGEASERDFSLSKMNETQHVRGFSCLPKMTVLGTALNQKDVQGRSEKGRDISEILQRDEGDAPSMPHFLLLAH